MVCRLDSNQRSRLTDIKRIGDSEWLFGMLASASSNQEHKPGMPMGTGMLIGMGLIVAGVVVAAYGLLPCREPSHTSRGSITPPEDAPLTKAHWIQIGLLVVALVVDVMKAATLGFVTPGMRAEYGLSAAAVALVPLSGLTGTTVGSFIWGTLADVFRPERADCKIHADRHTDDRRRDISLYGLEHKTGVDAGHRDYNLGIACDPRSEQQRSAVPLESPYIGVAIDRRNQCGYFDAHAVRR
jgi:hypothetical protein